MVLEQALCRRC